MGLKGTGRIGLLKFVRDLTWNEVHLLWLGLYSGFVAVRPRARQEPNQATKDALNWPGNQWYWKMGYIGGYVLKVALLVVAGYSNPGAIGKAIDVVSAFV